MCTIGNKRYTIARKLRSIIQYEEKGGERLLIEERKKPHKLVVLEVILRRLKKTTPRYSYFQEEHRKMSAGFAGERYVDRVWKEIDLPSPFQLIHDYCFVNDAGFTHQVDTIFITPHFLCLLEIKNIAGRLDFDDERRQCIRTMADGRIESMLYPVDQLLRHERYFQRVLKQLQLELPIVKIILIAQSSTIIGRTSEICPIMHSVGLPHFLTQQWQRFGQRAISITDFNRLCEYLNAMRQDKRWVQEINCDELRTGVLCRSCSYKRKMFYVKGSWFCHSCGIENNEAFYEALQDYRLLKGSYLTNAILCEEFGVPSKHIAYRILRALGFEKVSNCRHSRYKIPE